MDDNTTHTVTVEETMKWLESTESLSTTDLKMDNPAKSPTFSLGIGWNVGLKEKGQQEIVDAEINYLGEDYTVSKEAILGIANAIGLTPGYVAKTPSVLIQSHLNYWASNSADLDLKILTKDDTALAVAKAGIVPFSNVELLKAVLEQIEEAYGEQAEIYVSDLSHHGLHSTLIRVWWDIPNPHTSVEDDDWFPGVQIHNSLTGKHALAVQPFMYNPTTTSGMVLPPVGGKYNRKVMGQNFAEVEKWVGDATAAVIAAHPHNFEILESLRTEEVEGLGAVLADIYTTYKVPLKVRQAVADYLVASEDTTYYGILQALARTARLPNLPDHHVSAVLEVCGMIASDADHRCDSCHRVV